MLQRCQWHKRENVVAYLPERHRGTFRRTLQAAYEQPTYEAAKRALGKIPFYDQTHPKASVERVTGFRKVATSPKSPKQRARLKKSVETLAKLRKVLQDEEDDDRDQATEVAPIKALTEPVRPKRRR